jgi:4-amino-4-deoxy-L-arabinose transferase-like glycosyltransferase
LSRSNIPLALLLLAYLLVGALYAVRTPDWQAPDEPAHYNYVAQIARSGCCPVLEVGDWDLPYIERLTAHQFSPQLLDRLSTLQYEDHQPPLYYLLSSLVFHLTNGSLLALRLFSVFIGLGLVSAAYAVARVLLSPPLALAAAGLVAFVPQHLAMLAAVNNDGLSELIIGLGLLVTLYYLRGSAPRWLNWPMLALLVGAVLAALTNGLGAGGITLLLFVLVALAAAVAEFALWDWLERGHHLRAETWVLGLFVGLGLLTKINTVFLAGVIPLLIVLRWWIQRRASDIASVKRQQFQQLINSLVLFFIPVLLLGGVWWLRNVNLYGMPDLLGLGRHDLVVADQARTADQIAAAGFGEYLRSSLERTFISFWGQFGWMALPLHDYVPAFLGFLALAAGGWVVRWRLRADDASAAGERWSGLAWLLLALTILLAILQYIYYNTEFYQMQGRYLFPLLIPLGIFAAAGLDGWRMLLGRREVWRWIPAAAVALFIPLNLYIVWRVLPLLAPGN